MDGCLSIPRLNVCMVSLESVFMTVSWHVDRKLTYIYIYMCVCVCLSGKWSVIRDVPLVAPECAADEEKRDPAHFYENGNQENMSVRVCVCVRVCAYVCVCV